MILFGLVVCFAEVASSKRIQFVDRPVKHSKETTSGIVANCRFCGAEFKDNSSFCIACGRSQV